jgi:hypothetical protein
MKIKIAGSFIECEDFYCEGYRWFSDFEKEKEKYSKILGTEEQSWYGDQVLIFNDIAELNAIIYKLTLLRDSINTHSFKHNNIQKEFGNDQVQTYASFCPQRYPLRKEK